MRNKIELTGMKDINEFVAVCNQLPCKVLLTDGDDFKVSAKSLLGAIASMEWENVFVECEKDIYSKIEKWVR